jgi:hypothetical protein
MSKRQKSTKITPVLPPKCPVTGKSMYNDMNIANKIKFRIWSHDPNADMNDLHVYCCPYCSKYHIGHKSYYEKSLQKKKKNTVFPEKTYSISH